jgi:hypothetical protein
MTILIGTGGWPVIITVPLWWLGLYGSLSSALLLTGALIRSPSVFGAGYALGLTALLAQAGLDVAGGNGWRIGLGVGGLVFYIIGLFWLCYLRKAKRDLRIRQTRAFPKTPVD